MQSKARQRIHSPDGKIQAVLIIDLQYPDMKKAWVSLRTGSGPSSHWAKDQELFYDDALGQQPAGEIGLYLSDLVGFTGLPAAAYRPSPTELASGIARFTDPSAWREII